MSLGVLVLAMTAVAASRPSGPGPAAVLFGVAAAVGLGWLGYKTPRRAPRPSPAETLRAALAAPTPSTQEIRLEDVLGPWQFYVDAAGYTVTVDFHADGRYRQTIVPNRGEEIACPGGTWTLEGPHVELVSYCSVMRAEPQRVQWFFSNWEGRLVLLARDDPQASTPLLAQRCALVAGA